MPKLFITLVVLFSGSAFAQQYGEQLNCYDYPGRGICQQMDMTARGYNWRCTGQPCLDIWRNQLYNAQDLVNEIMSSPEPYRVSQDVGYRAYELAHLICNNQRRFSRDAYSIIIPLVDQENYLLNLLREYQMKSYLRNIRYCQIRVN